MGAKKTKISNQDAKSLTESIIELSVKNASHWLGETPTPCLINPKDEKYFDQWMSFVLIAGKKIKVSFRVHFRSGELIPLISRQTSKEPSELTEDFVNDFIGEYTNIIGGHLKTLLNKQESTLTITLPLTTRSEDDLYFQLHDLSNKHIENIWYLQFKDGIIKCKIHLEILDKSVVLPKHFNISELFKEFDIDDLFE